MSVPTYTVASDFDGVIHSYTTKWISAEVIPDPPVPGAIEWLNEIVPKFRVVIFTTRGKTPQGRHAVRKWLVDYGFEAARIPFYIPADYEAPVLITDRKPAALIYLDDRAVRFDGKNFPTADQIHREYIPWNKR